MAAQAGQARPERIVSRAPAELIAILSPGFIASSSHKPLRPHSVPRMPCSAVRWILPVSRGCKLVFVSAAVLAVKILHYFCAD
jgi:hypothetical protein